MKMTFDEILRAREHRILRHIQRYQPFSGQSDRDLLTPVPMLEGERILGIYSNRESVVQLPIMVTSAGLRTLGPQSEFIPYASMSSAKVRLGGETTKTNADTLVIHLRTGEDIELLVTGGHGQLRDIWGFDRFLLRVIGDYKNRQR